jgi:ribonuclease BN (tRNA processing enzyme)
MKLLGQLAARHGLDTLLGPRTIVTLAKARVQEPLGGATFVGLDLRYREHDEVSSIHLLTSELLLDATGPPLQSCRMAPSITLLGTGGPRPDTARGATALLIETANDAILIDAGRGVVRQLAALNFPLAKINPVLITHHHYDHIGELHDVILSSWLMGRTRPLRLYGPPETRRIVETLIHQVYDKDIESRVHEAGNVPWQPVETTDILAGPVCETSNWRITAEIVDHGNRLDFPDAFRQRWVCLGYRLECAQGVIAFSGDTVDCPGLRRLAANADILVQCCYLARSELSTPHARRLADYTLACADTVGRIATEADVGTLVLTHHRQKPDTLFEQMREDVAQDFAGPIVLGYDGLRIEL